MRKCDFCWWVPELWDFWEISGVRFLFPNRSLFCGLTIANCKVGMVTEWRVESKQKWEWRWFGNEKEIELENCWERCLGKRHLETSFWMGKNEHADIRAHFECLPKCELKRRGFYNKVDKMITSWPNQPQPLPADIPTSLRCALESRDHGGLEGRIVTDSATRLPLTKARLSAVTTRVQSASSRARLNHQWYDTTLPSLQ